MRKTIALFVIAIFSAVAIAAEQTKPIQQPSPQSANGLPVTKNPSGIPTQEEMSKANINVPALMNEFMKNQQQALAQPPKEEDQLKVKMIQPDTSILLWGTYRVLRFEDKDYGTVCYFTMTGQNISCVKAQAHNPSKSKPRS